MLPTVEGLAWLVKYIRMSTCLNRAERVDALSHGPVWKANPRGVACGRCEACGFITFVI